MKPSRKLVLEIALILFMSAVLGFGTQFGVIKRYLKGEFKQGFIRQDDYRGVRLITLEEAEDLFARGDALFVDTRPRRLYREGHILGAKNIPLEELKGPEEDRPSPISRLLRLLKGSRSAEETSTTRRDNAAGGAPANISVLTPVPRGKPLVAYCEGGDCRTSLALARILRNQGFQDVRVCQEGWEGWIRAGLPVGEGDE
jgi:rhodanese-related sulfurtransferase